MLRSYLYLAEFDWYLREIIGTNKLASTWFNHIIEENLADRVVVGPRLSVVENGKEGGVKLVVENRVPSQCGHCYDRYVLLVD